MDGVLIIGHQVDISYDWDAVRRLSELQTLTGADIILSSDWRYNWTPEKLTKHIESQTGFDLRITGSTPTAPKRGSLFIAKSRGGEIQSILDVLNDNLYAYVIIDDLDKGQFLESQHINLVQTKFEEGFTSEKFAEAYKILTKGGQQ